MADRMTSLGVVMGSQKQIRIGSQKTSDLEDDLTARVTRFARFMRFRRAIKGTCQAYCRPELSLGSQLAEVSEVLPTRPDQYSICAFRVTEYSGNRLYATPEKEARRRQRRHIGSAGREGGRQLTKELLPTASKITSKRSKLAMKSLLL
jgi:hypothetical protein